MKKGWETKTLADTCEMYQPKTISVKDMVEGGAYPVFGANGIIGRYDKFNHEDPQLLITCRGATCGSVNISEPHSWITGNAMVVRSRDGSIDRSFLEYLFRGGLDVSRAITGAAQPQITRTNLEPLEISYPVKIAEQQRIVGILDEAFAGLATAKANAEKNLQNARALFESHLQSVFSQRGEGWKMERIGNLTDLARGHNPPKSTFSYEEKPGFVRFYQIRDGASDAYTVYVPDTPQLHKMEKDDIMMVAYRHVGRVFRGVEGAFNVALCKISNARRDLIEDDFLFHLMPSTFIKGELLKRSERSLIPSMSIEHLRELEIPLPPRNEQQKLVKQINSLESETQRLTAIYTRKLAALEELKKALLHQAFSGEL